MRSEYRIWKHILAVLMLAVLLGSTTIVLAQAEDYLPTVQVGGLNINQQSVTFVPPTSTFTYAGTDPDATSGLPERVRFLLMPTEVSTRYQYESQVDELISFADPYWSSWMPYPTNPDQTRITFPDMPDQQHFLFAVQVMDADGAVSMGRGYAQEVVNFQVRTDMFRPAVMLYEYYLGSTTNNWGSEIASGQPLNFSWTASADAYGGSIVSYRHGFDLVDPDDPYDPGWAVPPGTEPQNLFAEEQIFNEGYHIFFLRVVDDSGQATLLHWSLNVVPFISPEYQLPLLLIDQTVDANSNAWISADGSTAYDNEDYRNAFWEFLEGAGGVANFNWGRDHMHHSYQVRYSDLVAYKTVLIYARNHSDQLMFNEFRPVNNQDKYVWLTPYQQRGGHLFLVGAQSLDSFHEFQNYMTPFIYDTNEEFYQMNGQTYVVGFGQTEMPDGTVVPRGPRQYPFDAAGISALDWSVPLNKHIYGRQNLANQDRKSNCAGIKAMILDDDFRFHHNVGYEAIADTIFTNPYIDWRDTGDDEIDTAFPFNGDEFVDANISPRTTPFSAQQCDDGPSGLCVEPMFTGQARYDWLREQKWSTGQTDWPHDTHDFGQLEDLCGEMALTDYEGQPQGSALTNGQTYGYLSYKNIDDKPNPKANVYWGFDPYRFDHDESKKAIRWVLDYFGLNLNQ